MAIGFSNGANIASALLLRHPEALRRAVLLAAMVPFQQDEPGEVLTGKRVLIVNGDRDPMATSDQTQTLAARLRERGADVEVRTFPGGHTIDPGQLPHVRRFLEAFSETRSAAD